MAMYSGLSLMGKTFGTVASNLLQLGNKEDLLAVALKSLWTSMPVKSVEGFQTDERPMTSYHFTLY